MSRIPTYVFAAILVVGAREAIAIPASPHAIALSQPDGTEITLYIRGDEFFHWYEDAEGYTVVQDRAENYVYALRDEDGELMPTNLRVARVDPGEAGLRRGILPSPAVVQRISGQSLPSLPDESVGVTRAKATGVVRNLVVLMRFQNHTARPLPTSSDFNRIFNAVGGDPHLAPSGSVRDVYLENSYGAFELDSTVYSWVNLPSTEQYYADGNSGLSVRIRDAIRDALELVDTQVDFGEFDEDGDGYVDAIAFVHSGYGAEWGGNDVDGTPYTDRIWSHRWWIPTWTSEEGVSVSDYHINPALWSTSGTSPGRIGVICHESGHFFGLPDLYDRNSDQGRRGAGIGSWGMMANSWGFDGSQLYPPHFSAWSKIELGWVVPTLLSSPGAYTASQVETTPTVYKVTAGFPGGEYLLIENRQPVGFDQRIPSGTGGTGGLAIWHIDEQKSGNSDAGYPGQSGWPGNDHHYRVALLQADGTYDLEKHRSLGGNRGDGGDVYRGGFVSAIDFRTVPSTNAYQNGNVVITANRISAISRSGSTMTFMYSLSTE